LKLHDLRSASIQFGEVLKLLQRLIENEEEGGTVDRLPDRQSHWQSPFLKFL
jgi:hypothetical protein